MVGGLDLWLAMIVMLIASAVSLMVHVPFVGALIRFRANYTPKGLHLDQEGAVQPHVGPVIPNYFAMLGRIKRIEGWQGFWKGIMPMGFSSLIILLFVALYMGATVSMPGGQYNVAASKFQLIVYAGFLTLLTTPVTVCVNRAITTPRKLPWFAPKIALEVLLTPSELYRPWTIYLAPGLILSRFLHVFWLAFIQRGVRALLLPNFRAGDDLEESVQVLPPVALTFYMLFVVITSIAIVTPLEVITTRLSVQRNHIDSGGFAPAPTGEDEALPDLEYAGKDEDVIALRPEDDPYQGFVHCGQSILNEEGPTALLRGWWITCVAGLLTAFS